MIARVDGTKTGYARALGSKLVTLVERDGKQMIAVILAEELRTAATPTLGMSVSSNCFKIHFGMISCLKFTTIESIKRTEKTKLIKQNTLAKLPR
jgi:hypothetical protein